MFEIVLVRHGKPLCDHQTKIRGCDFGEWVAAYERAPIDRNALPAPELRARLAAVSCIVTSTLPRSIESASLVTIGRPAASDPLFDEAGIPIAISFRFVLSPNHWDVLARAAWMLGWSPGVESFRLARRRAARAAARLETLSYDHGAVALFGHGMLNTLIAQKLRNSGWTGTGSPRTYWGSVVLRKSGAAHAPGPGQTQAAESARS
jgi:broad specificity phosphatase PhoE